MPLSKLKIRWGYVVAFLLLLLSYWLIFSVINKLGDDTRTVTRSYNVINRLESVKAEVIDAETGVRGFVLTKDERFLNPYRSGSQAAGPLLDELKLMTNDNSYYQEPLAKLENLIRKRLKSLAVIIDGFRQNNYVLSDSVRVNRDINKATTDSIRQIIRELQEHEQQLMKSRGEKLAGVFSNIWLITISSLVLAIVTIISSVLIYNRESRARESAVQKTKQYSMQLEERVNELDKVNRELEELKSLEKFTSTGRIARTIAHEVRNPLTNISLAAEQLKEMTATMPDADLLHEMISRNANRINQLVSELLNSTRFAQLEYIQVDMRQLMDEALELAADRIGLNQVKLEKSYDQNLSSINVDRERMRFAFLNIILNAVEAMQKGSGLLQISIRHHGNKCVIQIKDNGSGMDEETQKKIFDPYFTSKQKGNGLGLTNTQNIILNHKGFLSVRSRVNEGTTFTITLNINAEE